MPYSNIMLKSMWENYVRRKIYYKPITSVTIRKNYKLYIYDLPTRFNT